jgi:hypothetical protein
LLELTFQRADRLFVFWLFWDCWVGTAFLRYRADLLLVSRVDRYE